MVMRETADPLIQLARDPVLLLAHLIELLRLLVQAQRLGCSPKLPVWLSTFAATGFMCAMCGPYRATP